MIRFHKPTRFIRANADDEIINFGKNFCHFRIMISITRIAAVIDSFAPHLELCSRPKAFCSCRKVRVATNAEREQNNFYIFIINLKLLIPSGGLNSFFIARPFI